MRKCLLVKATVRKAVDDFICLFQLWVDEDVIMARSEAQSAQC